MATEQGKHLDNGVDGVFLQRRIFDIGFPAGLINLDLEKTFTIHHEKSY
jgi:hypothetical protein